VGLSLADAVTMASTTPATILGLQDNKGRLEAGFDADICVLDRIYVNKLTIIKGNIVCNTLNQGSNK
ncbi:amidohydrolase family protein, partial [Candidatus Latescibacterota bacterium]